MKSVVFFAGVVVVLFSVTTARGDILCTEHNGCRETGKTLRSNGGAYNHLGHRPRPQTKDELEGRVRRPTRVLPVIYQ
jgi:hypothetical protein